MSAIRYEASANFSQKKRLAQENPKKASRTDLRQIALKKIVPESLLIHTKTDLGSAVRCIEREYAEKDEQTRKMREFRNLERALKWQ
jgi:hypothetical protein